MSCSMPSRYKARAKLVVQAHAEPDQRLRVCGRRVWLECKCRQVGAMRHRENGTGGCRARMRQW